MRGMSETHAVRIVFLLTQPYCLPYFRPSCFSSAPTPTTSQDPSHPSPSSGGKQTHMWPTLICCAVASIKGETTRETTSPCLVS
jgi:hypothetical protein